MTDTTPDDVAELDETKRPALVRIAMAFGAMPYGAAARFELLTVTPAQIREDVLGLVATNLERLRDTLRTVAADHDAEHAELVTLRRLLTAADDLDDLVHLYRLETGAELEEVDPGA